MLSKEFVKYRTQEQVEKYKEPFKREFSNKDYLLFLRKFRGSMIYRGKSSLSYKFFDRIWFLFKRYMREQKYPQDTELAFKQAIFNLIPVLSTSNIKKGKRVQVIPVLLKQQRRVVLINKWLLSSQKNKSNVRGIKIDDIFKIIIYTLFKKGSAYDQKIENQKKSYNSRYVLLRPKYGVDSSNVGFNDLQRHILNKLKKGVKKKKVVISDSDNLKKYISIFKFLKSRSKGKFLRNIKKEFRFKLKNSWDLSSAARIYVLLDWLNKRGLKKKLYLDKKLLFEFIKKYYYSWKKKKGII